VRHEPAPPTYPAPPVIRIFFIVRTAPLGDSSGDGAIDGIVAEDGVTRRMGIGMEHRDRFERVAGEIFSGPKAELAENVIRRGDNMTADLIGLEDV